MPLLINQDVVRFDITMNEFHVMNALDSTGQLVSVKPLRKEHFKILLKWILVIKLPCSIFVKLVLLDEQWHQISTRNVFHDKVQIVFVLQIRKRISYEKISRKKHQISILPGMSNAAWQSIHCWLPKECLSLQWHEPLVFALSLNSF